jgi:MATE family multidrug resistance protein
MNRQILRLALPNIITNITVPLLSMVDLSLMGHLESSDYIGAVALGGMIFNFIYAIFSFLRMGTTGFTAQAFGRKDRLEISLIFNRAIWVALGGGLIMIALQKPIGWLSFYLVGGSEEVELLAAQYFHIRIYAAPATLGLMALNGWFLGRQNARVPMFLAIMINILNIVFNLIFVMGLDMKSDGVALGTLIAQYGGFIAGISFALREEGWKVFDQQMKKVFDLQAMRKFFRVNRDILIRTVCLIFTFSFFTAQSAKISDDILAVNTILLQFFMLFSYLIDGFAFAAESLVGKYVGAGEPVQLRNVIKRLFIWGFLISIPFTLAYLFAGDTLLLILTDNAAILGKASPYMFWMAMIPLVTFAAFIWDGIYVGATASVQMRNVMLISTLLIFLPSYYLLAGIMGNNGLWLALILFMVGRSLLMSLFSGKAIFSPVK